MRTLYAVFFAWSVASAPQASSQAPETVRVLVKQHVYEIDGCAIKHTESSPPNESEAAATIHDVLVSTEPLVVPKTTRFQIGENQWEPLRPGPKDAFYHGALHRGSFESSQPTGDFGGAFLMGEFLSYMDRDDQGAIEVKSVDDPKQFFEGLWLVSKATEATQKGVLLSPYRAVLNEVVRREKVKDIPMPVGKPTVLSEEIEKKLRLGPGSMALLAVPSITNREGNNRLVVLITASIEQ
ncbi:MAG: hypothetical protein AAGJ83_01365 [Planctomycetota bacterium]